ncbi:plus-3-domain-containing protein [Xylariaceae sp. FL0804]|nr:plus-3-domain-containing protein [Xylariaceae sp. FL0804]
MADVDDELLALVGGGESSDEEADQAVDESRDASEVSESESKTAGGAKAKKAAPAKKSKARRQDDSDEEEEGEASSMPPSPASQQSAPMDESDSEDDTMLSNNGNGKMDDQDDNRYPVDGLYVSVAEKEEILAMPELKREELLADRQASMVIVRQNALLRSLLKKDRGDDGQSAKKRKASIADLDETQRKTSRQRTRVGGSKNVDTHEVLRRARADKIDRARRREEDRERNKGKSDAASRGSPDDRADDDSDVEWSRRKSPRSRTPEPKEIPFADLRDMQRVRVGRTQFAQFSFNPGFNSAITGCYVRIAIGPDRETGEQVYRVAEIKGFNQGKPYAVNRGDGQSVVTDQYVRAAHGKAERDWPFIYCSDSSFTQAEFNRYERVCQEENVPFPRRPRLVAKIDDINALVHHTWTDAEINDKVERMRDLRLKFSSSERNELLEKLDQAKRRQDSARVAELQDRLDRLETPRLAFRTSLAQPKSSTSSGPTQQERLAQLNIENRRRNAEAVRKAQMKERAKVRDIEARIARGEEVEDDHSRRLKTKPKFMKDVNETFERKSTPTSGASTPANGTPRMGASKAPLLPHLQKLQLLNHQTGRDKKGMPQIHKPINDDDIIASLDLEIDVEID